jgi:LysM repeat protein
LLGIAQRHGLALGDLLRFNELPPGTVLAAPLQPIFLEKKKTTAAVRQVVVDRANLSLWHIAQQHGVRLKVLAATNPQWAAAKNLPLGTTLHLRPEAGR